MSGALAQAVGWQDFIVADKVVTELAPDEMTVGMYAKETGLSLSCASHKLKGYFDAGQLTRRRLRNHGWAYRPVKAKA